jgi:hypothetical protein
MSTAVTIREHIREALLDARPHGLTMAAIAGAVQGPWREGDVHAAVRRLWELNELGRQADGTFYVTEKIHASGDGQRGGGAPQRALDARAKRVGAEGRREGYDTRVRTRHVDPALLRAWCPRCRTKVLPRTDGACPKCATQTGANLTTPKPRRRRRRKPLRKGQAGYGPVCRCGGPKTVQAHTCFECMQRRRRGRKVAGGEKRRKPKHITEEQLLQARALYASGLSLRAVAVQLYPESSYASVGACSTSLYSLFKTRGWKLRPQGEVTAARNFKHGRKPRAQSSEQQNAYRRWLAAQRGWKTIQGPGRPLCIDVVRNGARKGQPCQHRALDGSDRCYSHDPARAEQRAAHLAEVRARVAPEERLEHMRRMRAIAVANAAARRAQRAAERAEAAA